MAAAGEAAAAAAAAAAFPFADLERDCGDVTSSQEDLLADTPFLGGDYVSDADPEEADEVGDGVAAASSQLSPASKDAAITMCTLPFTPSPSTSHPPAAGSPAAAKKTSEKDGDETLPLTRCSHPAARSPVGVRSSSRRTRGVKIRTPSPSERSPERDVAKLGSPETGEAPKRAQEGEAASGSVSNAGGGGGSLGPPLTLAGCVKLIGGELDPKFAKMDIIELAMQKGLFRHP